MPKVSDHELLRCIGRGSYGEVWLARNVMGEYRAVKIVRRDAFRDERPFTRELEGVRNFEPISRSHDGFVDILHVAYHPAEGYFYYVMELGDALDGGRVGHPDRYQPKTLAGGLAEHGRLSQAACLQLGLLLSGALGHLHAQGLVHRDVKPSNILYVGGLPKLADMGLVAGIDEARSYVGTEGFIPPEGPGSPQADVYSLGKVLYEASTGLDRQSFPELPDNLDAFEEPSAFLELNEVLLQACRTDPRARYASASAMQAELLVLANGRSVKRLRTLERRWSVAKQGGMILSTVMVLAGLLVWMVGRELRRAKDERLRLAGARVAQGVDRMERGDTLGAFAACADALVVEAGDEPRARTERFRLGSLLAAAPHLTQFWEGVLPGRSAWFSSDGLRCLLVEEWGGVRVMDWGGRQPVMRSLTTEEQLVARGRFSSDGRRVLTAHMDNWARVYDAATGELVAGFEHPDRLFAAAFDTAGERIVTACKDAKARVWRVQDGRCLQVLEGHTGPLTYAVFSPDGRRVATSAQDNTARLWDVASGQEVTKPLRHGTWVSYVAFHPDGQRVVTAGLDFKVRIWEIASGRKLLPDMTHRAGVASAEFSPDGRYLVTAGYDSAVRLWKVEDGLPLAGAAVLPHPAPVAHASFGPAGRHVITAAEDGSFRVWDLAWGCVQPLAMNGALSSGAQFWVHPVEGALEVIDLRLGSTNRLAVSGESLELAVSDDGRFVLSGQGSAPDAGTVVEVWSVKRGERIGGWVSQAEDLASVRLSARGDVAVLPGRGGLRFVETGTGRAWRETLPTEAPVVGVQFSDDGQSLVFWEGQRVHVSRVPFLGEPIYVQELEAAVSDVVLSPDGRLVAASCADPRLRALATILWDLRSGERTKRSIVTSDGVRALAFSPDSERLVTGGEDFTACVWDIERGTRIGDPMRHGHQVQAVAFSEDGRWVITGSEDLTVRVWDAETGQPVTVALEVLSPIEVLAKVEGRDMVVMLDRQGGALLWGLPMLDNPPGQLVALADFLNARSRPELTQRMQWEALKELRLVEGQASSECLAQWHNRQARMSRREENWAAVQFHAQKLLALRPGDPTALGLLRIAEAP